LNGVGDEDLVEPFGQDVAALGSLEGPNLQEGLDDLLNKEGIALGLADDQGL
jgi:hypothetical protein